MLSFVGLELEGKLPHQADIEQWKKAKEQIAHVFATKTQAEWCKIFKDLDACVEPILTIEEASSHPHNKERNMFTYSNGAYEPNPAPKLSRTPGVCQPKPRPSIGDHTVEVLQEAGYTQTEIHKLLTDGVVECPNVKSSL